MFLKGGGVRSSFYKGGAGGDFACTELMGTESVLPGIKAAAGVEMVPMPPAPTVVAIANRQ